MLLTVCLKLRASGGNEFDPHKKRLLNGNLIINEIIKTSYSEITFNLIKIPFIRFIQKKIIEQNYCKENLGKIKFN